MSRLSAQLNSAYIADDILFWRDVLTRAAPHVQFEVVLPSRITLGRGKKIALANRLGPHMIACVDADYDVLMQGATPTSAVVCRSPHVLHTGVYAIENLQCHADVLHRVCVMATLNDRELFDFRAFLQAFSRTVHPLLVWNVWAYRYGFYTQFSLTDFARTVELREVQLHHPERMIEALRRRVNRQIATLQRRFPQARATYKPLRDELQQLGVTPDKAYLYMRGHDLVDVVLGPTPCNSRTNSPPTAMPWRPSRRCCANTPPTTTRPSSSASRRRPDSALRATGKRAMPLPTTQPSPLPTNSRSVRSRRPASAPKGPMRRGMPPPV